MSFYASKSFQAAMLVQLNIPGYTQSLDHILPHPQPLMTIQTGLATGQHHHSLWLAGRAVVDEMLTVGCNWILLRIHECFALTKRLRIACGVEAVLQPPRRV
jgi:hypothetical protein